MSKSKWFKKMTPRLAWEQYVNDSVELFISNFYDEGIKDITAMCKQYAKDALGGSGRPYTIKQLNRVAELLEQYIDEKGYDPAKLYTEQELDEIFQKQVESIKYLLGKR